MARRRIQGLLCSLLIVLTLIGCATPYGRRVPGLASGYEDEQLGQRTYQVRVGKGWPSDVPNMQKFALYRAAELTTQRGYQYFSITASSNFSQSTVIYAPTVSTTTVTGSVGRTPFSGSATTVGPPTQAGVIEAHWVHLDFRMLDHAEVATAPGVIEAQKVIDDLKFFIERRRSPFGS